MKQNVSKAAAFAARSACLRSALTVEIQDAEFGVLGHRDGKPLSVGIANVPTCYRRCGDVGRGQRVGGGVGEGGVSKGCARRKKDKRSRQRHAPRRLSS